MQVPSSMPQDYSSLGQGQGTGICVPGPLRTLRLLCQAALLNVERPAVAWAPECQAALSGGVGWTPPWLLLLDCKLHEGTDKPLSLLLPHWAGAWQRAGVPNAYGASHSAWCGVLAPPHSPDSQLRASRPASVTGVSHRFSTWSMVRCSDRSRRPASPNCGQRDAQLTRDPRPGQSWRKAPGLSLSLQGLWRLPVLVQIQGPEDRPGPPGVGVSVKEALNSVPLSSQQRLLGSSMVGRVELGPEGMGVTCFSSLE